MDAWSNQDLVAAAIAAWFVVMVIMGLPLALVIDWLFKPKVERMP